VDGIVGIYLPIHIFETLGIAIPEGAVVHRLTKSKTRPLTINAVAAPSPYLSRFEDIWSRYPKMLGKKQACKAFLMTVKTEQDWSDINNALENYKKIMPTDEQYIKHGSTWFSNWQDYLKVQPKQQSFVKSL
jgi:hypothetical protein